MKEEELERIKQQQLEAHPEVNDDPQDGCENLASPPLRRTHELRGDEGAESAEDL